MTFLRFFDCSGCGRIEYYDCIGTNVVKKMVMYTIMFHLLNVLDVATMFLLVNL